MKKKLFSPAPSYGLRLIIVLVLSLVLMFMDHYQQSSFQPVRAALSVVVLPLQYLVAVPAKVINWVEQSVVSHQTLQDENTKLQAQVLLLRARLQKVSALEKENTLLRALLQSYPRQSERVRVAQLLAIDSDPFIHEAVLNQGRHSGVYVGQPVLDARGVFGQVIAVGPFTSRVLLLTDSRSAIPVEDSRTNTRAIAVGTGERHGLSLSNVPATTKIKVGDTLVTSGFGGRFPMGYPVGTVASIHAGTGLAFDKVRVQPSAQFTSSRLVLLVWPAKNSLQMTSQAQASLAKELAKRKAQQQRQQGVTR